VDTVTRYLPVQSEVRDDGAVVLSQPRLGLRDKSVEDF